MIKKIKAVLAAALLFTVSVSSFALAAEQTSDTESGTVDGTPDKYVEAIMEDSTINFGTFTVNNQKAANEREDANGKYVIFESISDLSPAQNIIFNEGASNSNIFAKVTYTGETYPATGGLSNSTWLFFKDTAATYYVQSQITGTLTSGGGGVTMPGTVTEVGSYVTSVIYYSSIDSGITWTRASKNIYVALGSDARLYISDSADLSAAPYCVAKGEAVQATFLGNNYFAETSTFPTGAGVAATFDFGYYIAWDNQQSNTHETFSALVDLPMHAAYNHNWTWNLSVIVEYFSAV